MDPVYVQIGYGESVVSKRNLLSSQINILNLIKRFNNYRKIRKKELQKKIKLKTETNQILKTIKQLEKDLPKIEIIEPEEKQEKETPKEKTRRRSTEAELRDIEKKLEKLGKE